MNIQKQITDFINAEDDAKRKDLETLHQLLLNILPKAKLWFDTGVNAEKKTVFNPTIGYGLQSLQYANGSSRDFFQIGVSANKTGISVYILGLKDKTYIAKTYGDKIGKAKVSGYCIRFKKLSDIDLNILEDAIRDGIKMTKKP